MTGQADGMTHGSHGEIRRRVRSLGTTIWSIVIFRHFKGFHVGCSRIFIPDLYMMVLIVWYCSWFQFGNCDMLPAAMPTLPDLQLSWQNWEGGETSNFKSKSTKCELKTPEPPCWNCREVSECHSQLNESPLKRWGKAMQCSMANTITDRRCEERCRDCPGLTSPSAFLGFTLSLHFLCASMFQTELFCSVLNFQQLSW